MRTVDDARVIEAIEELKTSDGWSLAVEWLSAQINDSRDKLEDCNVGELIGLQTYVAACRNLLEMPQIIANHYLEASTDAR